MKEKHGNIVIQFLIPPAAVALYARIVLELDAVVQKYLSEKKLQHRRVEPGVYIIHQDQPTIKNRIKELDEQLLKLKNIDKAFEGEVVGMEETDADALKAMLEEKDEKIERLIESSEKLISKLKTAEEKIEGLSVGGQAKKGK